MSSSRQALPRNHRKAQFPSRFFIHHHHPWICHLNLDSTNPAWLVRLPAASSDSTCLLKTIGVECASREWQGCNGSHCSIQWSPPNTLKKPGCIFFQKGVSTSTARPECVNAKWSCRFKLAKSAAAPNAKTKPTSAKPMPITWQGGDENPIDGTVTTCQKEHLWHSDVLVYAWRWCQFIQFWGLTQVKSAWFICLKLTSLKTSGSQQLPTSCLIRTALNTCEYRHCGEGGCQRSQYSLNEVMKLSYSGTFESK